MGRIDEKLAMRGTELMYFGRRGLFQETDEKLKEIGINRSHRGILYIVHIAPGVTTRGIRESLGVSAQAVAPFINDLIKRQLIRQVIDPKDRRYRLHYTTKAGAKVHQTILDMETSVFDDVYQACGPKAFEGFLSVLGMLAKRSNTASLHDRSGLIQNMNENG